MAPATRYARSGDLHIAYQVVGEGPIDLIFVPTWISQVEHYWAEPGIARYFQRLASFSRLMLFDRRGRDSRIRCRARPPSKSRWTMSSR